MVEAHSAATAFILSLIIMSQNSQLYAGSVASGNNELMVLNSCTCSGHNQVYECTVVGEGATVWKGTAFECAATNNEIVLFHEYNNGMSSNQRMCNNGTIVGRIIMAENGTYTSQVTVAIRPEMANRSIQCIYDSIDGTTTEIGSAILTITTVPFPPPTDVYIVDLSLRQVVFKWSSVSSTCHHIRYNIISNNCGHCPDITTHTTATCTGILASGQQCTVALQTIVCNNLIGNTSKEIEIVLRVPSPPMVDLIPIYFYDSMDLVGLKTIFFDVIKFNISDGIDGSATSYDVNYTESTTGFTCASVTIPALTCAKGNCEHELKFSSSLCQHPPSVTVVVTGTNRLGKGQPSILVFTPDTSNNFVDLSFDLALKTVTCLFLNQQETSDKICSIVYGNPTENCRAISLQSKSDSSDSVRIGFPTEYQISPQSRYCFAITASNGTFSVIVEGSIVTDVSEPVPFSINRLTFGICAGVMSLAVIIISVLYITTTLMLTKSKRALHAELELIKTKVNEHIVYEELDYQLDTRSSPPTAIIDTEENTAYLSALRSNSQ